MVGHLCAEEWGAKESGLGDYLAWGWSRSGGLCPRKGQSRLGPSSGRLPWNGDVLERVINHRPRETWEHVHVSRQSYSL